MCWSRGGISILESIHTEYIIARVIRQVVWPHSHNSFPLTPGEPQKTALLSYLALSAAVTGTRIDRAEVPPRPY
jgi:hypothetical protein